MDQQGMTVDDREVFAMLGEMFVERALLRKQLGTSQKATIDALGEANRLRGELHAVQRQFAQHKANLDSLNVCPEADDDMTSFLSDVGEVTRIPTTLHSAELNGSFKGTVNDVADDNTKGE